MITDAFQSRTLVRAVWLLFGFPLVAAGAIAGDFRAGAASVDITPAAGTPMLTPQRPPFRLLIAEGAHDKLHAKALVMEKDGERAAIVTCDLTSIPITMIRDFRREIDKTCTIRGERVMISATHTHTTPQIRTRFLKSADPAALRLAEEYAASLPAKIAESVRLAEARLAPVKVSAGKGFEDSVSFNRRFLMKDGTVETNPGKTDPSRLFQIARPAGPIDPEMPVVAFEATDARPVALLVNFALHQDTTGGSLFSADFAYTIDRLLAAARGEEAINIFSIGTAGNINHYDLLNPAAPRRTKGYGEASRIGTILAACALKTLPDLVPVDTGRLQFHSRIIEMAMPPEKGAQLAKSFKNSPSFFDGEAQVRNEGGRQTFEAEIQVITVGEELAWVAFPGEIFVEQGLALKNASPYRWTIIHSIANAGLGYIPNRKAYREGAYEGLSTRFSEGSAEALVEAATSMLIEAHSNSKAPVNKSSGR